MGKWSRLSQDAGQEPERRALTGSPAVDVEGPSRAAAVIATAPIDVACGTDAKVSELGSMDCCDDSKTMLTPCGRNWSGR